MENVFSLDLLVQNLNAIGQAINNAALTISTNIPNTAADYTWTGTHVFTIAPSAAAYKVSNVQVVAARQTGWGAPTNTLTRTTFDTTTVTLPQLAARVGALITDLMTHGLIGV